MYYTWISRLMNVVSINSCSVLMRLEMAGDALIMTSASGTCVYIRLSVSS